MPGLAHFCEHLLFMVRLHTISLCTVLIPSRTPLGHNSIPQGKRVLRGNDQCALNGPSLLTSQIPVLEQEWRKL
jgi:hypothetical protein